MTATEKKIKKDRKRKGGSMTRNKGQGTRVFTEEQRKWAEQDSRSRGAMRAERVEPFLWKIDGDTFPYRVLLSSNRAEWRNYGEKKYWMYSGQTLPPAILALLQESAESHGTETQITDTEIPVEEPEAPAQEEAPEPQPEFVRPEYPAPAQGVIAPSYWERLIDYMRDPRPVIALVGPAGNGKTTTAEAALLALGYTYNVVDGTEFLTPADLVGFKSYSPTEGTIWQDARVAKMVRYAEQNDVPCAILINEWDALNPKTAMIFQGAFQDAGRYIELPGNPFEDRLMLPPNFVFVLTMNTYGTGATRQYVGRNAMDGATMDRVSIIPTVYENEANILQSKGYSRTLATRLEAWAKDVRIKIDATGERVILSNRTLNRIASRVQKNGIDWEMALNQEFYERLDPVVARNLQTQQAQQTTASRFGNNRRS